MLNDTDTASTEPDESTGVDGKRPPPARSEIAFPYTHLEDAVTVARAISENGYSLFRDQIAGVMGVPPTSGGFSLKIGAARMFRLIEAVDGKYQLSSLGVRILSSDESEARSARREAFLNIELYQKTFETFRNRPLPERPNGLEGTFVSFGVAPKQKDKARLAFERSAQFAGFFHAGKDRLVEPIIAGAPAFNGRHTAETPAPGSLEAPIKENLPVAAQQLLIKGLLERLPAPDTPWSLNERARWLRALAVNLAMIYGEDDDGEITVTIPTKAAALLTKLEQQHTPQPKAEPPAESPTGGALDDETPF